jgi:uncharacterized protein (TIGR02265 family)
MSRENLVYSGAVEALFQRALENRLTPACLGWLREAGLDLEKKLAPAYPLEQWKRFLRIATDHVYAGVPAEAAYYSLGERFVDGYFSSLFGRALLPMMRLAGTRRTLLNAGLGFRIHTNFGELRVVTRGSTALELWVNDVTADQPTFLAGVLSRTAELAGGQRVVALPEGFDGTTATFHVHWVEQAEPLVMPLPSRSTASTRASTSRPPA